MPVTLSPVLLFDLDGTVLAVNSFRNWVRYLLRGHFGKLSPATRLWLSLQTAAIMVRRKLLRQDHAATKARLQQLWIAALAKDPSALALTGLVNELYATVRPNLQPLLAQTVRQHDAVLATAAAGEYAHALGAKLGFKHIIATPLLGYTSDGQQNVGAVKRDRALAFLAAQGWAARPRIFLTDHSEDLPLILVCDKILWLGPDDKLAAVQAAAPGKSILAARTLTADEIAAQLAAL